MLDRLQAEEDMLDNMEQVSLLRTNEKEDEEHEKEDQHTADEELGGDWSVWSPPNV